MHPDPKLVRETYALKAGVAAEEPIASLLGARIIEEGGNAVDASVTVSLALAVTIPHLGGIGGDYFALVRTPDGYVDHVNGSGHAPRKLTLDYLRGRGYDGMPPRSPHTVTVPGMIGGLYTLWKRYGSMEWRELVEPAARLASEGFPMPKSLAGAIEKLRDTLAGDPGSKKTFLALEPVEPGTKVRFPGLARLLEIIAEDPSAFYRGEPAEAIAEYLSSRGGVMEYADLAPYQAQTGTPLTIVYRDWRLWEMPPNSQGATTLHMMAALEQWDLPRDPVERSYYILAAAHAAYRVRDTELGDPRYMELTHADLVSERLLSKMREESSRGPTPCTLLSSRGYTPYPADTTFYTIIDREEMIVAGIQSLYYPFGSGLTEPRFQVPLNNRGAGFTLREGLPNTLAPGKKPLHTLSAVIAEHEGKRALLALGASGGHFRPQQHSYLLTSVMDHGYTIGESIALPRVLWQPWTCRLVGDEQAGNRVPYPGYSITRGGTGVASGIQVVDGKILVATDPRGDGFPQIL